MMSCMTVTNVIIIYIFLQSVQSELPTCREDETTFMYTECDRENGRWSVHVPKNPNQCKIVNPHSPLRGKECGFSCDAGHYLDHATQSCQVCQPGTYSLGSGVRFDSWNELPDGFISYAEAVTFSQYGYKSKVNNCSLSLWKPANHFVTSNDDDCTSLLSYSVNLKSKGFVSFSYQFSDSDVIFHFYIQNNQCQTSSDKTKNIFLDTTGTEWRSLKVNLEAGVNVLNWKTTGILLGGHSKLNPVRIRSIEITGVSYTTKCHQCRGGYFSPNNGSHWCNLCPANHYSKPGATKCESCDIKTEFAPMASETCLKKPPCKEKDYFSTHSACDENKMTTIKYDWVEPKVCLETLEGSVSLPNSGRKQPCAPCNPGFHPNDSNCLPCPKNMFSNGTHDCVECPANTSPHYGYFYIWWDRLPETMSASCISLTNDDCRNKKGWEAVGDQLQTVSDVYSDVYLILLLTLKGFSEQSQTGLYGKLTFAFQLDCDGECHFYFMKEESDDDTSVIESWRGFQPKQTYVYDVTMNNTIVTFTWAFQQGEPTDVARIYIINVTNALGSPADLCIPCAAGHSKDSKCIPCPGGNYLDVKSHECVECESNSVLNNDKTSCLECGTGTKATDGHLACANDCHFLSPTTNRHYDFSNLSMANSFITKPTFTSTGRQYNHVYNFSLCDNAGRGNAHCIDNVTFAQSGRYRADSIEHVVGMACRSTAIPMSDSKSDPIIVHSQPAILASKLVSVAQNTSKNITGDDFFPKDDVNDLNDVVYHMTSPRVDIENCPNGRHTYIFLRCNPDVQEKGGVIETMSLCPDGTCNGCDFYFLWRSIEACPTCQENDYDKVVGGCKSGNRETKYLWKRYPPKCKGGVSLPQAAVEPCQDITFYIEVAVIGGVVLLLVMSILVCRFWKKSKKLEYKYHRLVLDGKGGLNGGELPTADTCALSESESDGEGQSDEVIFHKKKSRLFAKKKVTDYESVLLQPVTTGV